MTLQDPQDETFDELYDEAARCDLVDRHRNSTFDSRVRVRREGDMTYLSVRDPQGRSLELEIEFARSGPKVRVCASELVVQSRGELRVECEDFRLHASRSIVMQSEGNYRCQARELAMQATHGAIQAKANDEVQLLGELILMNCERPSPMARYGPGPCASLPAASSFETASSAGSSPAASLSPALSGVTCDPSSVLGS